jgi:Tol biopolymer transport system component
MLAFDRITDGVGPGLVAGRQAVAFLTTRNGGDDVYVMNADGSGQRRIA